MPFAAREGSVASRLERAGEVAVLRQEVEELRERIKVLERIATDERSPRAIAAEIDSLRDR